MDILSIIQKKRDKLNLNENEINFFINAYTKTKEITDYQAAALLMAIYINGLNDAETYYLTKAMLNSGKTIDFEGIDDIIIDKHSTGGVGDKVSLILLPICVACGIKVAKISGKGLGHTGGTIDKLESIGVDTNLQGNEYLEILKKTGMFIMGQTKDLVPADKLLYDLRNATNTVNSLPLIAASIVSKKIALKTDYIFLDVKVGDGAFCSNYKQAMQLSKIMMNLFKKFKRNALIHITNMDQPLGKAIGGGMKVAKVVSDLFGSKTQDFAKDISTLETVGGSYGGSSALIEDAANKAGKKYGLFANGAKRSANRLIDRARIQQYAMQGIADDARDLNSMRSYMDPYYLQYQSDISGGYD